jgi:double-stranded uracil-DNA glycosylase
VQNRLRGLPPVVGKDARVLILGTMPGRESLSKQQYYANPRNAFWRVVEPWCGGSHASYELKCAQLIAERIALWDVLLECERAGSSDSSIANPVLNDVSALVRDHPTLAHLLFNGRKARALYDRSTIALPRCVELATLPSTSPANARPGRLEVWRAMLAGILR